MNEHDKRILAPKNRPADDREALAEFARSHFWCQACGREGPLTLHHIIGGRGGRSDEAVNLFACCWDPCHMLCEGLDIRRPSWTHRTMGTIPGDLLPKLGLEIVMTMKIRAGELTRPILLNHPGSIELVTSPEWDRLTALNGKPLPDLMPVPAHFEALWRQNRPELQ